jgi:hypothetical protein
MQLQQSTVAADLCMQLQLVLRPTSLPWLRCLGEELELLL